MTPEPTAPSEPSSDTDTGPGPDPARRSAAAAARAGNLDRRTVVLSALVLLVAIVGGTALVAAFVDDGPRKDTWGQLEEQGGAKPHIIPRPNEGRAPEEPGDRGGWAQLSLLGLIVVAVVGIGYAVVRGTKKTRANRAAWLAAAESGRDGALDRLP